MNEEKAADSELLLDSSVWLEYLLEGSHQEIIESEKTIYISSLSIFEMKKKLLDRKVPEIEINEKIDFIKERAITIVIDNLISEKAATISFEKKIPAIDSLIYATARLNNTTLITQDNDFRGLPHAKIID